MQEGAPFVIDEPLPIHSLDWIRGEMAKKQLPPLIMASELAPVSFITTGIPEIDEALKPKAGKTLGGFPRGRVSEIYGMEGVGKTSLTLQSIAGMQKAGKKALFIDTENALNVDRAKDFGVDLKKLAVSTEAVAEKIIDIVLAYIGQFDVIVIDSLAGMVAAAEFDEEGVEESGGSFMGLKARIMGQFMRKVVKPLADSGCALVFVNQERMNLQPFGKKTFTPGGKAVPYATSLRIELKSNRAVDRISKTTNGVTEQTGQWITAHIQKSKVGMPHVEARFKLLY